MRQLTCLDQRQQHLLKVKEVYRIIIALVLLICSVYIRIVYSNVETGVIKRETRLTE